MSTPFAPINNPQFPQRKPQIARQSLRLTLHLALLQRHKLIEQRLDENRINRNHHNLYGHQKQHDVKRKSAFPEIIDDFEKGGQDGGSEDGDEGLGDDKVFEEKGRSLFVEAEFFFDDESFVVGPGYVGQGHGELSCKEEEDRVCQLIFVRGISKLTGLLRLGIWGRSSFLAMFA